MNIDKLKKVIAEANPIYLGIDKKYDEYYDCNKCGKQHCTCIEREFNGEWNADGRILRLNDVLIASKSVMSKNNDCTVFEEQIENLVMNWNLKDNNLDNQSDELWTFLSDLLV